MKGSLVINTKKKQDNEKRTMIILICLCFAFIAVDLSLIFNDSVWCDEAFTMLQCEYDFDVFLYNIKTDAWPPFYGIASRIFTWIFGVSVPILKIFSIIPAFIVMLLGATVIYKEFKSKFISVIFILMTACMPVSIHMNLELRGYSWAMLFVTCCGLLAYYIIKLKDKKTRLILSAFFILFAVLGAYTHYYALISIGLIALGLFIFLIKEDKKNIKICGVITAICFILYFPWLRKMFSAAGTVAKGYWIKGKSIGEYIDLFVYPFTMEFDNLGNTITNTLSYICAIIVLGIIVFLGFEIFRMKDGKEEKTTLIFAFCSSLVFIATIIVGFFLSKTITPVLIPRYVTPCLGLLWLSIAIGAKKFIGCNTRLMVILGSLFVFVLGYGYSAQRTAELYTGTEEAKVAVRTYMKNYPTRILSDSDYLNWTEIEYYFPESIHYYVCRNIRGLTLNGRVKHLLYLACDSIPVQEFLKLGYDVGYRGHYDFDGCYYFSLYEITKKLSYPKKSIDSLIHKVV